MGGVATLRLGGKPGLCHRKTGEQSENVYENKGTAQRSTTPDPLIKGGEFPGSPPRTRRRRGWWDFATLAPIRDCAIEKRENKARMSMKTKERLRNQPPLAPPYPRRGIPGLPSSDEEGLRVARLCDLGVKPRLRHRKTGEQSENVYENKGTAQKSTTPGSSLSKEGNSRTPLLGRGGVAGGAPLRPWCETAIAPSKNARIKRECL